MCHFHILWMRNPATCNFIGDSAYAVCFAVALTLLLTAPFCNCVLFWKFVPSHQVGTSFALQGLIDAKAVIWNDFRWPHPPLAWGDLLNMLDNEPLLGACKA